MNDARESTQKAIRALERRAETIRRARPAYAEFLDFYVEVFRTQLAVRARLTINLAQLDRAVVTECLRAGHPLVERHDPGLDAGSFGQLWQEMKSIFRRSNAVLESLICAVLEAELSGALDAADLLLRLRPQDVSLLDETAARVGVDPEALTALVRAVTFPHWQLVAQSWLPTPISNAEWSHAYCPVCGGPPAMAETRGEASSTKGLSAARRRFLHCGFCGMHWPFADMQCPACGSCEPGDAKYLFTDDEPELRIDFCRNCHHYLKVVDGDRIGGRLHVGLESLTTIHLDAIAQERNLSPLDVSTCTSTINGDTRNARTSQD